MRVSRPSSRLSFDDLIELRFLPSRRRRRDAEYFEQLKSMIMPREVNHRVSREDRRAAFPLSRGQQPHVGKSGWNAGGPSYRDMRLSLDKAPLVMTRFLLQDSHHPQRKIIVVNRSEARHNQLLKLVPSDSVGVCANKRLRAAIRAD
jgi:hypothetical protein